MNQDPIRQQPPHARNISQHGMTSNSHYVSTAESGIRQMSKAAPSVSKNMPLCFRGKPISRTRGRDSTEMAALEFG